MREHLPCSLFVYNDRQALTTSDDSYFVDKGYVSRDELVLLRSFYEYNFFNQCRDPEGSSGPFCTRYIGHKGCHIGHWHNDLGILQVLGTWGIPYINIKGDSAQTQADPVILRIENKSYTRADLNALYEKHWGSWCFNKSGTYICTRPSGHVGLHISQMVPGNINAVWGTLPNGTAFYYEIGKGESPYALTENTNDTVENPNLVGKVTPADSCAPYSLSDHLADLDEDLVFNINATLSGCTDPKVVELFEELRSKLIEVEVFVQRIRDYK